MNRTAWLLLAGVVVGVVLIFLGHHAFAALVGAGAAGAAGVQARRDRREADAADARWRAAMDEEARRIEQVGADAVRRAGEIQRLGDEAERRRRLEALAAKSNRRRAGRRT